jgi:2-hydroxy-6-oxonona-2,4-dienedioate hydrolase
MKERQMIDREREATVTRHEVVVGARRVKVWTGGQGEALVLLHGAWGGAEMHWSRVWAALAQRFVVIAPELPGIGDDASPGLPSFAAYAAWLVELLDALDVQRAWCLGNSFGAAVAWQLAARLGPRCRGLILVNGVPPVAMPALVRTLAAFAPIKRLLRALFAKLNFSPAVVARAFADPAQAPPSLAPVMAAPPPARIDLLVNVLLGTLSAAPRPSVPILLAWGESDRLAGTAGPAAARKLQDRIPGAQLALLPAAGHCPQIERPAEFVAAVVAFVEASRS